MFCPNCGAKLPDGVAFCNKCGTKIAEDISPREIRDVAPAPAISRNPVERKPGTNPGSDTPANGSKKTSLPIIIPLLIIVAALLGAVIFFARNLLSDTEIFDPFEGISITYSGTSPQLTAQISDQSEQQYTLYMTYTLDKSQGLENGEVITLTVDADEKLCKKQFNAVPSRTEKKYTVSGNALVSSESDLSISTLAAMENGLINYVDENTASLLNANVTGAEYLGYYLLAARDAEQEQNNYLIPIARVDVSFEDGSYFSYYTFVKYANIAAGSTELSEYTVPSNSYQDRIGDNHITYNGYASLSELAAAEVYALNGSDAYTLTDNVVDQPRERYAAENDDSNTNSSTNSPLSYWGKHATTQGQIFPSSSSEYLSDAEVSSLDPRSAQDAINEIYARNGGIFVKYPEINDYYSQFSWYYGTRKVSDITNADFNVYEKSNIEKLAVLAAQATFP